MIRFKHMDLVGWERGEGGGHKYSFYGSIDLLEDKNKASWMILGYAQCPSGTINTILFTLRRITVCLGCCNKIPQTG